MKARARLCESVEHCDAEAPGYFDLCLYADAVLARVGDREMLRRLRSKHTCTNAELIRAYTPGAWQDPVTGKVEINRGYDERYDEGALEQAIWDLVQDEATRLIAAARKVSA